MKCVGLAGEDKNDGGVNSELWQACAGPLINLPLPATHVIYFPQGHSEQVNSKQQFHFILSSLLQIPY